MVGEYWHHADSLKDAIVARSMTDRRLQVVVLATSFVGGMHFGVNPPMAIVIGAVMGLIWYAVART